MQSYKRISPVCSGAVYFIGFLLFSWVTSKTKQINWYLFLKERYKKGSVKIDLRNPHVMLFIALFKKCQSLAWVIGHCISQWQSSRMTCHCIHN